MSATRSDVEKVVDEIHRDWHEMKKDLKEKHEVAIKAGIKEYVDPLLENKLKQTSDAISKAELALDTAEKAQAMTKAMRVAAHEYEENVQQGKRKRSDPELKKAFLSFIRQGDEKMPKNELDTLVAHTKSLNSGADPAGGYVVVPEMDDAIVRILYETSPMRQISEVKSISSNQFDRLIRVDLPAVGWADRDASDSLAPNTTPTYKKMSVRAFTEWAEPAISQDLIDDAYVNIEDELTLAVAQAFDIQENTAFVLGSGVGQPRGFLTYPAGSWNDATPNSPVWGTIQQVHAGSTTALTYAGIVNLCYELKSGYRARAKFLANRMTVAQMRLIVDNQARPLWEPGMGSEPALFMGYPIVLAADMPLVASASLPLAFGDFSRGYLIVDRMGTRVIRDPYTQKPFVKFYTTRRVGGDVCNFEAIKLQVMST